MFGECPRVRFAYSRGLFAFAERIAEEKYIGASEYEGKKERKRKDCCRLCCS